MWIDHAPSGELRARVMLLHEEGSEQRLLYGRDCDALSEAVFLVISMASEAETVAAEAGAPAFEAPEPRPALPSAPASSAPPHHEPAAPSQPAAPPTSPAEMNMRIGAAFAIDRGALPHTSFAGSGVVALGVGRIQAALAVSYFSREQVTLERERGASTEFSLITAELRGCYYGVGGAPPPTRAGRRRGFALGPCAGLEFGAQRGQGVELARAASRTGLWAAGLFGVELSLGPYGRLVPTGSLALGVALKRPRFEVEEAGTVFQAKPLFMRATVGLMIDLNP